MPPHCKLCHDWVTVHKKKKTLQIQLGVPLGLTVQNFYCKFTKDNYPWRDTSRTMPHICYTTISMALLDNHPCQLASRFLTLYLYIIYHVRYLYKKWKKRQTMNLRFKCNLHRGLKVLKIYLNLAVSKLHNLCRCSLCLQLIYVE